jgi:hypothetical protein
MLRRNCNVKLDDLRWDRPELVCEPRGAGHHPGFEKTAMLLDVLAALDLAHRRGVATKWRTVAETFAGVPDGQ